MQSLHQFWSNLQNFLALYWSNDLKISLSYIHTFAFIYIHSLNFTSPSTSPLISFSPPTHPHLYSHPHSHSLSHLPHSYPYSHSHFISLITFLHHHIILFIICFTLDKIILSCKVFTSFGQIFNVLSHCIWSNDVNISFTYIHFFAFTYIRSL